MDVLQTSIERFSITGKICSLRLSKLYSLPVGCCEDSSMCAAMNKVAKIHSDIMFDCFQSSAFVVDPYKCERIAFLDTLL